MKNNTNFIQYRKYYNLQYCYSLLGATIKPKIDSCIDDNCVMPCDKDVRKNVFIHCGNLAVKHIISIL